MQDTTRRRKLFQGVTIVKKTSIILCVAIILGVLAPTLPFFIPIAAADDDTVTVYDNFEYANQSALETGWAVRKGRGAAGADQGGTPAGEGNGISVAAGSGKGASKAAKFDYNTGTAHWNTAQIMDNITGRQTRDDGLYLWINADRALKVKISFVDNRWDDNYRFRTVYQLSPGVNEVKIPWTDFKAAGDGSAFDRTNPSSSAMHGLAFDIPNNDYAGVENGTVSGSLYIDDYGTYKAAEPVGVNRVHKVYESFDSCANQADLENRWHVRKGYSNPANGGTADGAGNGIALDTVNAQSAPNAMKFSYNVDTAEWWRPDIQFKIDSQPTVGDGVCMWIKADKTMNVRIGFMNHDWGTFYAAFQPLVVGENQLFIPWADFKVNGDGASINPAGNMMHQLAVTVWSGVSGSGVLYLDDIGVYEKDTGVEPPENPAEIFTLYDNFDSYVTTAQLLDKWGVRKGGPTGQGGTPGGEGNDMSLNTAFRKSAPNSMRFDYNTVTADWNAPQVGDKVARPIAGEGLALWVRADRPLHVRISLHANGLAYHAAYVQLVAGPNLVRIPWAEFKVDGNGTALNTATYTNFTQFELMVPRYQTGPAVNGDVSGTIYLDDYGTYATESALAPQSGYAVAVQDNFDRYADDAALRAKWLPVKGGSNGGTPEGAGNEVYLDTVRHNSPSQSMKLAYNTVTADWNTPKVTLLNTSLPTANGLGIHLWVRADRQMALKIGFVGSDWANYYSTTLTVMPGQNIVKLAFGDFKLGGTGASFDPQGADGVALNSFEVAIPNVNGQISGALYLDDVGIYEAVAAIDPAQYDTQIYDDFEGYTGALKGVVWDINEGDGNDVALGTDHVGSPAKSTKLTYNTNTAAWNSPQLRYRIANQAIAGEGLCVWIRSDRPLTLQVGFADNKNSWALFFECDVDVKLGDNLIQIPWSSFVCKDSGNLPVDTVGNAFNQFTVTVKSSNAPVTGILYVDDLGVYLPVVEEVAHSINLFEDFESYADDAALKSAWWLRKGYSAPANGGTADGAGNEIYLSADQYSSETHSTKYTYNSDTAEWTTPQIQYQKNNRAFEGEGLCLWVYAENKVTLEIGFYGKEWSNGPFYKHSVIVNPGELLIKIPWADFIGEGGTPVPLTDNVMNQLTVTVTNTHGTAAGTIYLDDLGTYEKMRTAKLTTKVLENFEDYANSAAMRTRWTETSRTTYPTTVTLDTNSRLGGSNALSYAYNSSRATGGRPTVELALAAPWDVEGTGLTFNALSDKDITLEVTLTGDAAGTKTVTVPVNLKEGVALPELLWSDILGFDLTEIYKIKVAITSGGTGTLYIDNLGFTEAKTAADIHKASTFIFESFDDYADNTALNKVWAAAAPATLTLIPGNLNYNSQPNAAKFVYDTTVATEPSFGLTGSGITVPIFGSGLTFWAKSDQNISLKLSVSDMKDATNRFTKTVSLTNGSGIVTVLWTEFVSEKSGRTIDFSQIVTLTLSVPAALNPSLSGTLFVDDFGLANAVGTGEKAYFPIKGWENKKREVEDFESYETTADLRVEWNPHSSTAQVAGVTLDSTISNLGTNSGKLSFDYTLDTLGWATWIFRPFEPTSDPGDGVQFWARTDDPNCRLCVGVIVNNETYWLDGLAESIKLTTEGRLYRIPWSAFKFQDTGAPATLGGTNVYGGLSFHVSEALQAGFDGSANIWLDDIRLNNVQDDSPVEHGKVPPPPDYKEEVYHPTVPSAYRAENGINVKLQFVDAAGKPVKGLTIGTLYSTDAALVEKEYTTDAQGTITMKMYKQLKHYFTYINIPGQLNPAAVTFAVVLPGDVPDGALIRVDIKTGKLSYKSPGTDSYKEISHTETKVGEIKHPGQTIEIPGTEDAEVTGEEQIVKTTTTRKGKTTTVYPDNTLTVVLIASGCGVVVIAGGLFVLLLLKKKRKKTAGEGDVN